MRRSRILFALTLFIALSGAHARQPGPPHSLGDSCSISSDPRWTPQEKFVWEHVCAGEDADFNKAEGYGGRLDPGKPDDWPQNRVLRPAFLQAILFKEPYRRALTRGGAVIVGARFTETIDLENAELEHPFGLQLSLLEKGVSLRRVRSKFPMGFGRSKVAGAFDMYEVQLDADLEMQTAQFADVNLSAHVGGLNLHGSKVSGTLNMNGLHVNRYLDMTAAEFADVNLAGAHVGGQIRLTASKVTGTLDMTDLQVERSLHMVATKSTNVKLNGAHVAGTLNLNGLKVSGTLAMEGINTDKDLQMSLAEFTDVDLAAAHVGWLLLDGSKVTRMLRMNAISINLALFMREAEFADVDLVGAHVSSQLSLDGSKVTGELDMNRLHVDQALFIMGAELTDVNLGGAHVGTQLGLRGSKVAGRLYCPGLEVGQGGVFMDEGATFSDLINCSTAKIKGDLHLNGSFKNDVILSEAEIDGVLDLKSAQWSDGVSLVLRNAKVGLIPTIAVAWAKKLDLDGFTYRNAGATDRFENWFGRVDRYAPQPYDQLASVVKNQGNSTLATAIRYSGRERERSEATGRAWAWLTTLKWVIGYGS